MRCPLATALLESGSIIDMSERALAVHVVAVQEAYKHEELGDQTVLTDKIYSDCEVVTGEVNSRHRLIGASVTSCLELKYQGLCDSFGQCVGRELSERVIDEGVRRVRKVTM